jgi:hypothetical protein
MGARQPEIRNQDSYNKIRSDRNEELYSDYILCHKKIDKATYETSSSMTFSRRAARHTQSVQGSQLKTLRPIGCSLKTQPFH